MTILQIHSLLISSRSRVKRQEGKKVRFDSLGVICAMRNGLQAYLSLSDFDFFCNTSST
jgi:hypothetical protein